MMKRLHCLVFLSFLVILGGWIEEAKGQTDGCLVNLTTNAGGTLSASYIDHNPFTGEDETVYVYNGDRVPKLITLEVTATADTGYKVGQWYIDGSIIEGAKGQTRQTTVIRKDTQIKVDFESSGQDFPGVFFTFKEDSPEGTITATYQDNNYNDIVVHSGQKVPMDVMVTFTATPKEGYEFDFWRVNGEKNPFYLKRFGNTGKLSAQTNDEIEAVFRSIEQAEKRTVTFQPRGDGGSLIATVDGEEITSGSQVEVGKTVLFTAKPNENHMVGYWFMNDQLQHHIAKGQMTFEKEINLDLTVEVSFETVVQETYHITFQEENDWGYLTVQSWPNGINAMGMPISSGDPIDVGTIVTFDVELQEGYELKAFIIDGVEYQANATSMYGFPRYQTTLTKDLSISVKAEKPTAQEYVITFNSNPEGGSIQGSYMTMAGGSFTTVQLNSGDKVPESSMVTFNASANEGYEFVHWTLDGSEVSTDLEYMFEMSATCEVQGVFKQITTPSGHLITLSVGTGGTLKCAYSNGQEVQSGDYVADGSALRFNAEPESGYVVDQWTINGEVYTKGNGRKTIIQRASKDLNVGVSFKKEIKNYTITYSIDEGALMKSALYYDKVNYNYIEVNSGDKLPEGTKIEFEVDLQMGYTVKEWLLNDMPIDGSQGKTSWTITLRENSNIHVALLKTTPKQQVTYTATGGGSIQASIVGQPFASGDMISEGSYITFTATPNEGFITDQWTINGDKKARYTGKNEIVERLGNEPMTVEVSFKENKAYTISYTATNDWGVLSASYNKPNGQEVLVSPEESVADGTELFFIATPNKGFVIDTWTCNGKTVEGYNDNLFYSVVVHENVTIEVNARELAKHIVTFDSNPEGGTVEAYYTIFSPFYEQVDVLSGDPVIEGTRVTFEATPIEGYQFDHWIVNNQKINNEGESEDQRRMTSVLINDATTVQAVFKSNSTPKFKVIYSAEEGGSISATIGTDKTPIQSGDKIEQNTLVTFTATASEGYKLNSWIINGDKAVDSESVKLEGEKLIITLDKDVTVSALFKDDEPVMEYGFDLVGVSVTSANVNKLNELVGVSIGKDGYIRYDASAHKLSLRDVTLDNSSALLFAKGTNSYTIELAGTNSFIGQLSTESNLTITGQGTLLVSNEERSGISVGSGASLVIKGKECLVDVKVSSETGVGAIHGVWDANSTLKIEDATVKAESTITGTAEAPFPYAIGGFKAIESINGKITIPENGKIGKHTFTFGGKEYTLAFVLSKDEMPTSKVEISHHVNALTEVLETGINVYPNPFAERIVITIPVEKLGQTAYISSMLGELIQQVVLVDIETVIYTEALTSGTYILRIGNETQLLIKE